jgi:hypothetical protein
MSVSGLVLVGLIVVVVVVVIVLKKEDHSATSHRLHAL